MVKIVKSCCVTGCKNLNLGDDSGVQFFKFPEAKNAKKRWLEAIRNHLNKAAWEPETGSFVCSVHFVSGQHSPHEWHPDFAPSVFRSLRSVKPKAKSRLLEEYEETRKPRTPAVKRLQGASGIRKSLSTATRLNKPKATTSRKSTGSIASRSNDYESSIPKIVDVRTEKDDFMNVQEDGILLDDVKQDTPKKSYKPKPKSKQGMEIDQIMDELDLDPKSSRPAGKKSMEYSGPHRLKNLSVVLERTPVSKKAGGYIKEEPSSEIEDGDYYEYPLDSYGGKCKRCTTLQNKLKRQEDAHRRALSSKGAPGSCRRCPVLEHKLKRAETEIDTMLEAKLNKCQKCSSLEMRIRKLENTIRKNQTDASRTQAKLSSLELSEETFKKFKQKVKQYTGFPNHETLMIIFSHVKDSLPDVGIKSLTPYQMFIIVLMRMKLNFPFWDLTYRFGTSPNVIQSFYPQYLQILEAELSHVVLWPKANLQFRLEVLAGNLKANFSIIKEPVKVETLMIVDSGSLSEEEQVVRLCASIYHISQLISSNHHQQLLKILKSKSETDRSAILSESEKAETNGDTETPAEIKRKDLPVESDVMADDIDDSDIFFEDLTKDLCPIPRSTKESLELECQNIQKEIDQVTQRLSTQFKFYTGLRDFDVFNNMISFLSAFVTHVTSSKLNYAQQLHLILMRLKLNLEVQDLSYMFRVDPDHIVYLTSQWIEVMSQKLSRYIDWPAGIEDVDSEKRLQGSVKLKYQILWGPKNAPRNPVTGRDRERLDSSKLLRACAALYNIDDIEVFGKDKEKKHSKDPTEEKTVDSLTKECMSLRAKMQELQSYTMSSLCKYLKSDALETDDAMVQYYTGFPTYERLKFVFDKILPSPPVTKKLLTPFQQFVSVLLRLKLNLATWDIGTRVGVSQSHTHKLIQDWIALIHVRVAPYITWPDDDEDSAYFTEILRKTYAHIRPTVMTKFRHQIDDECPILDIPTLVCGGLYNLGSVSYVKDESDSECDFDEEW